MSKESYFKQFSLAKVQFSSMWPIDRTLSGLEWTWERWQWRGTPHSPKLQHYWNLTIRLFSVISRTLVEGRVLPPSAENHSVYSAAAANLCVCMYVCVCVCIYIYIYIYIYIIIQCVKAHAIPCSHQPPTRRDNSFSSSRQYCHS